MKTRYIIEVDFEGDKVYGVREKAEKLIPSEARQVISILEEHKLELMNKLSKIDREVNLNNIKEKN